MPKKDKKNKEHQNDNDSSFFNLGFFDDLFKPLKLLLEIHIKLALRELKRDSQRMLEGIVTLISGCFFLSGFWILLGVLGILALYDFVGIKLFFSVLIVASVNLFFVILMFISARLKLKKSFFSETRKIIEETIDDLK